MDLITVTGGYMRLLKNRYKKFRELTGMSFADGVQLAFTLYWKRKEGKEITEEERIRYKIACDALRMIK